LTVNSFREFLRTLFRSTATRLREERIADLEQQRDYFKGRAERLELILMQSGRMNVPEPFPKDFIPAYNAQRSSRLSLAELQRQLTESEEAAAKPKEN
jgi:hypothetical protein